MVERGGLENRPMVHNTLIYIDIIISLTYQQPTNIIAGVLTAKSPRTRHNPTDIRTIRGYPPSLKLFRMGASRYWYVRLYIRGGPSSGVKKSTRCENLKDAEEFAITWYEEIGRASCRERV